jgi:hypothetical protein
MIGDAQSEEKVVTGECNLSDHHWPAAAVERYIISA